MLICVVLFQGKKMGVQLGYSEGSKMNFKGMQLLSCTNLLLVIPKSLFLQLIELGFLLAAQTGRLKVFSIVKLFLKYVCTGYLKIRHGFSFKISD